MNLNLGDNMEEQAMPILCRYKELPEQPFRKYIGQSHRQSIVNNIEKKREIKNMFGNGHDTKLGQMVNHIVDEKVGSKFVEFNGKLFIL